MTFEQRKQERQALIDHLLAQDWNVFGTLKFVNGRTIGRSSADKLLRSYWNRIDRMFFGKAAERQNMRVPRWCFAHEGSDSENYHVHFVLKAATPDTATASHNAKAQPSPRAVTSIQVILSCTLRYPRSARNLYALVKNDIIETT